LSRAEAYSEVEKHLRAWRVLAVTPAVVLEAARASVQYQLAYWDAQVWATAKLNQIPTVLTEDLQHLRRIEGVEFLSPFKGSIPGME
jgi:predicted nucleic acid-binding protein